MIKNLPARTFFYPENQIQNKILNFWNNHKIQLTVATAIALTMAVSYLLRKQPIQRICVDGFNDKYNDTICKNGKFVSSGKRCMSNLIEFKKLIDQCATGAKNSWCLDGKFYRELTQECKDNPGAALCNGKYDYQKFLDRVDSHSKPMCGGCCVD